MLRIKLVKLTLVTMLLMSSLLLSAQIHLPVAWKTAVKKIDATTYDVVVKAAIDKGWHIYAQKQPDGAVSYPTSLKFAANPLVTLAAEVKEIGRKQVQKIPELEMEQLYYADSLTLVQRVKLKNAAKTSLKGTVSFMACTKERCLPEKTISFVVELK